MRDTSRTGTERRLRYGQIGGGTGSFIGAIHRRAVALDGGIDLVAGALCSDPGRARASARDLFIPEQRSYATWQELVEREAARPEGEIAGAMGDIGSHCENLVAYVTGLAIAELSADLATFVPGRRLDDDAGVLPRFAPEADAEPARGVLWVSQVAAGARNRLTLRVYGTSGGLLWDQEDPDRLHFLTPNGEVRTSQTGDPDLCPAAQRASHLFPGAPEGFLGAFANIYRNVADTIRTRLQQPPPERSGCEYPDVNDGARGVRFIERVVENARGDAKWTPF